jgi:uncharacterized membrane protein
MRNIAIMLALLLGAFGISLAVGASTGHAGRTAVAAVFFFTALGHFAKPAEMQEMIPPWVPERKLVVLTSGFFELVLALGILIPSSSHVAAFAAIAFLVLATPLNVYSALNRVSFGGHGAGPKYLLVRLPLQVILIAWTWWFSFHYP